MPLVRQTAETDCAAACLTMVLAYYGKVLRLDDVRLRLWGEGAIVNARSFYPKPDGWRGPGRYPDFSARRDGR